MARTPLASFLADIHAILSTGANTKEISFYPAIRDLLNAAGVGLNPSVFAVMNLKNQGGGLPDGGLFSADQFSKKNVPTGEDIWSAKPSRGAIEVKGLGVELRKLIASEQVGRYLDTYGHVLVTNLRSFALVQGNRAQPTVLEDFDLAPDEGAFRALLTSPERIRTLEPRFLDFLRRVLRLPAPLRAPEDVAWFLASYARDALAEIEHGEIPEMSEIARHLEDALGVGFGFGNGEAQGEGDRKKARHFFHSVLVQTIFYGVFSAWVLWCRQKNRPPEPFVWRTTSDLLHLTMLQVLFHEMTRPSSFFSRFLQKKLELAQEALNRVDRPAFFERFHEHEAVQYFYEPFLEAFDPELRKELGVWYTPGEVVRYMVERVDRSLRTDLGIEEGLASKDVYLLDPCCGTGAFLVAVLDRIHRTLLEQGEGALAAAQVARAATSRVFGFELLPAPFVVAHLQISLFLQEIGSHIPGNGRAAVYLTNALTGWDGEAEGHQRLWDALREERNAAAEVKRKRKILVILGNPPYNAFAGVQPREEQESVEIYKEGLHARWKIKKFNLDDLYVRFLRVAERKILEHSGRGVVCYISNASYTSDKSFVVLRKRLLDEFDQITIDNLNGDSRETGKLTPDGAPDPSVFSTRSNPEGIQVGTAIGLLLRTGAKHKPGHQAYVRWRDFWGKDKRALLLDSLEETQSAYHIAEPSAERFWSFKPAERASLYLRWPRLPDLCGRDPISGLAEKRKGGLISMDRETLEQRMKAYFDPNISWEQAAPCLEGLRDNAADYNSKNTRKKAIIEKISFSEISLKRYSFLPLDSRWCYHASKPSSLWNRERSDLARQLWPGNRFLATRTAARRPEEGQSCWAGSALPDHHLLDPNVVAIPLRWRPEEEPGEVEANLSEGARVYLAWQGFFEPDDEEQEATVLWYHALAISFAPAWQRENGAAIREDFPRIPLPRERAVLEEGARLGRLLADLVDPDVPVAGVTQGKLRPELLALGQLRRSDGESLDPERGDLAVACNWGALQRQTVVMPGKGKVTPVQAERVPKDHPLGAEMVDVWLNKDVYLAAVPRGVWAFTVGGYPVIKKWLSYREKAILGRDLTAEEARHLSGMVRRIGAILLLSGQLDGVYQRSRDAFLPWSEIQGERAALPFRFVRLALEWTQATAPLSSREAKFAHPAYLALKKLGSGVVPEVLRWIAQGGVGPWDELLHDLSRERPELKGAKTLEEIHQTWVRWGKDRGLLAA
jgi:hypothetical protein